MKYRSVILIAMVVALMGCSQSKSPEAVQHDMDRAAASGEKHINRAETREQRADANAEQNVANSVDHATGKAVDAAVNTALAHADAEHKVALAQCEGYAGDQQKSCKSQADAAWDGAKERAKAIKAQN